MSLPAGPVRSTVDLTLESAVAGGSTGLTAYTVRPAGTDPLPAVVVVHEIFGVDDQIRGHADRMAAMGYVVAAPDLFTEGSRRQCLKATFAALSAGEGRAFRDISATRQYLLDREDVSGPIGIIGFCLGGAFALLCTAPDRGFAASAPNYGRLPKDPEVLRGGCPVVASYGGRDVALRGAAAKLEGKLTEFGVPHDVKEYPGAGHQFLNTAPNVPWYMTGLAKVMHMGPDPAAAADAWARIEGFFAEHLRGSRPDDAPR